MDNRAELTPEALEEYFKSDLNKTPYGVRERYDTLLLDEQLKKAKERQGKPPGPIPLESRENFLRIAKVTMSIEDARRALKMERDWERASRGGRPPIGGAVDD